GGSLSPQPPRAEARDQVPTRTVRVRGRGAQPLIRRYEQVHVVIRGREVIARLKPRVPCTGFTIRLHSRTRRAGVEGYGLRQDGAGLDSIAPTGVLKQRASRSGARP